MTRVRVINCGGPGSIRFIRRRYGVVRAWIEWDDGQKSWMSLDLLEHVDDE